MHQLDDTTTGHATTGHASVVVSLSMKLSPINGVTDHFELREQGIVMRNVLILHRVVGSHAVSVRAVLGVVPLAL